MERQYVHQRYYGWGQIDVLPYLEWNGFSYADEGRVLREARVAEDGFRRPRTSDDAVISWLTSLLWGGFFKEKYAEVIETGARDDGEAMEAALEWALGVEWAGRMMDWAKKSLCHESASYVGEIRQALAWTAWRREPMETFSNVVSHWVREFKLHLSPPMPFIAFLGPDGSGKSTVIDGVRDRLKKRRVGSVMLHWRPGFIRPGTEPHGGTVEDPHGKPPRGLVSSILKIGLLVADWQLGYWLRYRHQQAKAKIVISDRFYDDLFLDPKRYRYGGGERLARLGGKAVPQPDLIFVLHAPAATIFARKQEVSFEELESQLGRYEAYAEGKGSKSQNRRCLINVDRSIDEIVDEVISIIEESPKIIN
ncbi:hypothetical protein N9Z95_04375 [Akkermansiaceae bacterium]|nr:hypothetical protein [Akkermansiaceae bacterium]